VANNQKEECIFCKIITGEIPCYKIYENKFILAFLDVNPISDGHTLVIPKKHYENVLDCEDKYLEETIKAIKIITNHYKKNLKCTAFNIANNSGKDAGQVVNHLHFHIIPRYKNDGLISWPTRNCECEKLSDLCNKLSLIHKK